MVGWVALTVFYRNATSSEPPVAAIHGQKGASQRSVQTGLGSAALAIGSEHRRTELFERRAQFWVRNNSGSLLGAFPGSLLHRW
jgi:hypothetical protein